MIKAVFFDIDGTLLSFKTHELPKSTRDALYALKEKDIKIFIATGRPPISLESIKHILNFEFDGYVALNGQYCLVNNEMIYDSPLPVNSIDSTISYMKEKNISCLFAELEYSYLNIINDRVHQLQEFLGSTDDLPPVDTTNRIYENKVYQLCPYILEDEEEEFFKHMPYCKSVRWNPLFVDVIPENGGKPVGIQKILDYFNLSQDECMAFGDGGNDISMLQFAKIGVAMGNANESVKEHADYVTTSVDDNGIINALKHYNII